MKTLPGILRSVASDELVEAAAIAAFKRAAGDGLRNHAVPVRLDGRILIVAVGDSTWQRQLGALSGQLLYRVNTLLGQSLVSRIELRIDPTVLKNLVGPQTTAATLNEDEIPFELWTAASAIEDRHLRQSFLKAAVTATRRLERRQLKT